MSDDTTSREKILKKIRKALINKSSYEVGDVDNESEIYQPALEPLDIIFAQRFTALNGKFVFCENENEFVLSFAHLVKENKWENIFSLDAGIQAMLSHGKIPFSKKESDFINTDIGLTLCEYLIARTGSVLMTSRQASGRRLPVYSNIHIVVAYTSQLVYNIKDALKGIKAKYGDQVPSMIANITGPSRTADIEKTLVQGAHGPKDIYVFLIDDIHTNQN